MSGFRRVLHIVAAIAACIAVTGQADAADIRRVPGRPGTAVLEGEIKAGDYEKLRSLLRAEPDIHEIYLASLGGLIRESLRMGRLIRHLGIATIVPSEPAARQRQTERIRLKQPHMNARCASACFFVFIGGINRGKDTDGRLRLGIHRPHFPPGALKKSGMNLATALRESKDRIETYLMEMEVPVTYAEHMFATPHERMRWITEKEFETDFAGLILAYRDRFNPLCDKRTEPEKETWRQLQHKAKLAEAERSMRTGLMKKHEEQMKCEKKAQIEHAQGMLRLFRLTNPVAGCPDPKREEDPGVGGRDPRGAGSIRQCF